MNQEALFSYTTPLNVNIVNLKGEEHLYVEGDISTNDIDFVNDIMTKNCQESMQKQILERNMKLDLEHEAFKGDSHEEKEINKTKIPAGKIIDATVKKLGDGRFSTSVKCEINRFNPNYKSIKGNLVEKYLDAFSVAFLPTDISYEQKDGKSIRMLNDVTLLNVAMTGNPCNTRAQMAQVFTKSMDALEEYKKRKSLDPSVEGQLVVKSELKFKYAKRTGSPGHYIYWYKNPKTGKLESGDKPKKQTISTEDWKKEDVEKYKSSKRAIEIIKESGTERIKEIDAEISLKEKYIKEIGNPKTPIERDRKELLEGDVKNLERRKKDWIETFDKGIKREESEMRRIEDKYTKNKSHSTNRKVADITKLHTKNSKMTDDENDNTGADEGNDESEGSDVEAKSVEMLKSISNELKSMNEKYDVVAKDNVAMKEAQSEMKSELTKITEALSKPVHKAMNNNTNEADVKAAESDLKSVDPLELC